MSASSAVPHVDKHSGDYLPAKVIGTISHRHASN